MDAVTELKQKIGELEKQISLRQIALQSGVNYITLRNIKFGKSTRVTDGVMQRLTQFHATFSPDQAVADAPKKRGRKPGSKNAPKAAPKTAASPSGAVWPRSTHSRSPPFGALPGSLLRSFATAAKSFVRSTSRRAALASASFSQRMCRTRTASAWTNSSRWASEYVRHAESDRSHFAEARSR